jgi:pimeloyl-ACP methyl ester carboxylesterase
MVSIAPNTPANQRIMVRLCLPAGATPSAVQFLIHGCTYDHTYWDFPDPSAGTNRYSYVASALAAGYATLAYDWLGTGQSSHPASATVTVDSEVWVAHQLVQALRSGTIGGPSGPISFSRVIEESHSFGTLYAWLEASRYHDVDAVILTGALHRFSQPKAANVIASFYPANQDPQFAGGGYDQGYLTTKPGTRYDDFYSPAAVDSAVLAWDEAHKSAGSSAIISGWPQAFATPLDIRAPVLLALGARDSIMCGTGGADCSNVQTVVAGERPSLGSNVPSVDGFLLSGAGHNIDLALNAPDWFAFARQWTLGKVPPV